MEAEMTRHTFMMADVYADKFSHVNFGLTLAFILLISAVNLILIVKITKVQKIIVFVQKLVIGSQAFGDITFCLFLLLIILIPEDCSTAKLAFIYHQFLLPFVYGVGLILLAGERTVLLLSQTANGKILNILKILSCSAFPWISGLIIIFSVIGIKDEWSMCCSTHLHKKARGLFWACVITPAFAAVLLNIYVACEEFICVKAAMLYKLCDHQVDDKDCKDKSYQNLLDEAKYIPPKKTKSTPPLEFLCILNSYTIDPSVTTKQCKHLLDDKCQQDQSCQNMIDEAKLISPKERKCTPRLEFSHSLESNTVDTAVKPCELMLDDSSLMNTSSKNTFNYCQCKVLTTKHTVLLLSLLNLICTTPVAAIFIGSNINPSALKLKLAEDFVVFSFYWMSVFRSFLSPLIWICSLASGRPQATPSVA